jgi:hypothetical protein
MTVAGFARVVRMFVIVAEATAPNTEMPARSLAVVMFGPSVAASVPMIGCETHRRRTVLIQLPRSPVDTKLNRPDAEVIAHPLGL